MSLTSYSRKESLKPEVSERRTKLPKKALAKKKVKNEESSRSRKRSVGKDVGLEERASKMVKTEPKANIGKKVGNGAVALLTAETPHEVIVISDSEDDFDHKSKDHKQDQTMLRSRTRSWKTRREVAPSSTASNTPTCLLLKMEGPDSESDLPPDPVDIIKPNKSRPKELQNALQKLQAAEEANTMLWQEMETEQQQHQSAQDLVKKLQQEMEKRDVDTLLERQKQDTRHEWEVAALHETVQHLRDQLRASQDTVAQRTDERQALQAHYEQERADRKKEQQGHEEILNDTLKSKAAQEDSHAQTAQDEARLSTEVEMLKAAARLNRGFSIPSPVPSQSPSMDEERKEDNVRKSYVRVKRQYDILRAAAKDLSECTRSLDLSSFSEFGRYMERLRADHGD
jgi:hypothetical protein